MALEALQDFGAVVVVVVGIVSRRLFNDFQLFWSNVYSLGRAVLLPFSCVFHRIAADSVLMEGYSFQGYHTHRRFLHVVGKTDRKVAIRGCGTEVG